MTTRTAGTMTAREFVLLDDGSSHEAAIKAITFTEGTKYKEPDVKIDQYQIDFAIEVEAEEDGAEDQEVSIRVWAAVIQDDDGGDIFPERAKITGILKACGIEPPEPGDSYDTDDWLGASCLVTVEHSAPDSEGRVYNRIKQFSPKPKAKKPKKLV